MPTAVWCDSKAVAYFAPHGSHTPLLGPGDQRPDREALFIRLSATMVERNGNFRDIAALCVRALRA
jgi:hypothetical protein